MTTNQGLNKKKKRNGSFLVSWITRIISFFSALFLKSWVGRMIMNGGKTFNESFTRKVFFVKKRSLRKDNSFVYNISQVFDNGFFARTGRSFASLLANLSVNVYGMFFISFGLCAVITQFVAMYILPNIAHDAESGLITAASAVICAVPFLTSTKSVIQLFSGGRVARKITIGLFCIPEEKLWNATKVGGADFMLLSAFMGIAAGALTYFVQPITVIIAFVVLIAVVFIFSYAESGIIISCILIPFLQYIAYPDLVMLALVVLTSVSYAIKVIRGKRTFHMSSAGVMVILFGISMIIAGLFSSGGESALAHSIYNVIIIFGAYFVGGNLTKNDKVRKICVKILTVSLVTMAFLQFWNLYYINISAGVEQTLNNGYFSILNSTGFGVASDLKIPGLLAAMLSPLLIAECFNRKRIYSVVALLLCFVPVVLSIAYFGTIEIMIALLIGVAIYLVLHSPKSVANILIICMCVALVFIAVPMIASELGVQNFPRFADIVEHIFPDSNELSAYRSHILNDTWEMLRDGNLLGIGSGTEAYKNAMSSYVTPVSANADMPGTSYFQILCEAGVLGLFIFVVFAVFLLKNGLRIVIKAPDRESKTLLLGLISGFTTALILASVSCIFEDVQMRYLFWLCAGLISSQTYSGEAKEHLETASMKNTANEIDLIERV